MKKSRMTVLAVLLVVALALSACVTPLPNALTSLGQLADGNTAASVVAASARQDSGSLARSLVTSDLENTLERVYESVAPSVVNIQVTVGRSTAGSGTPALEGTGSGFVWDKQGHIVTNNHVVESASRVRVTFPDGTAIPAQVVGRDPDSDLAVIKVDPTKAALQPITLGDSTQVKVGQFVVAIGNPFGLEGSMSFGIVSALGRSLPAGSESVLGSGATYTIPDVIQTDAPVNPGNSGGVLVDLSGKLIGVPSAIESPVRASAGIGFAIPSVIVSKVVPVLIEKGRFEHPWIGISGGTLTPELAAAMNLPESQRGALVAEVTRGSPAEKAGLRGNNTVARIDGQDVRVGGDVIIAIDGQPVRRFEDLTTYLARRGKVGQTIELKVIRDGKEMTLSVTLAARPAQTSQAQAQPTAQPEAQPGAQPQATPQPRATPAQPGAGQPAGEGAWLGISGVTLTAELATAMKLPADQRGALVQSVVPGSPAEQAGLKAGTEVYRAQGQRVLIGGDVIVSANGRPVETMQDLVTVVGSLKPGDNLSLDVLRDGKQVKISATLAARPTQPTR